MSKLLEYLRLCRLCLVKENVNVPIFADSSDVRQIFLKISACLPVKVSQDDNLPKHICDSCLYKVDLLYQFWNTSVNAEKQLIQWITELGLTVTSKKDAPVHLMAQSQSHSQPHSITETIMLKEEHLEMETQQQHSYSGFDIPYQPEVNMTVGASADLDSALHEDVKVGGSKRRGRPPKQKVLVTLAPPVSVPVLAGRKRRSSATKAAAAFAAHASSDDSDADDKLASDTSEPDFEPAITKEEADSEDEEYVDNPDSLEPTTFVDASSTCDPEQAGPSGLMGAPVTTRNAAMPANTEPGSAINMPVCEYNEPPEFINIKLEPLDINWGDEDDLPLVEVARKRRRRKRSVPVPRGQKQPCIVCGAILRGKVALINHYLVHKEAKIKSNMEHIHEYGEEDFYRCCVCMKEFITKIQLEKHGDYHIERPFLCVICHKSFKQTQNFLYHMEIHNDSKTELKCDTCKFTTTFKLAYDRHVKSHTRQEYKCHECDKVFAARTWFIEHKNYHTGERPFSCEECGKCFAYSRYLTAHKKSMHPHCYFKEPTLNECKICKKTYSHKNSLRLHMKMHTGENTYLCDICGKKLSSTDKLQLHRRIHTGYKPYACTICEKKFTKKDILTDHIRTHSGEKPFSCETCGKCFSQRSPLTIHRRYHTGERPYVCHLCNKGFVSKGILGIHLKQGKHH